MSEHPVIDPEFFAGRQALYARLRQYMLNPGRSALTLTGQEGTGKTALLRNFRQVYDTHIVSVYLPLAHSHLDNETVWLHLLVDATNAALAAYGFDPRRVPALPADDTDLRRWLNTEYLPEVTYVIRPQRRLVWLLDDAGFFISAMTDKRLPDDSPAFLQSLMEAHAQLSLILTARINYEHRLSVLAPLYHPAVVQRLEPLNAGESRELLQYAAPGLNDAEALPVYLATGGNPRLLQRFVRRLSPLPQDALTQADVTTVTKEVYAESAGEFRDIWRSLNRDERLVLTGVSSLIYQNASRPVSAADLVGWLRNNDYPMDIIAVNAALRSLEYHEILTGTAQGVAPVSSLMQTWLLENARLEENRQRSRAVLSRRTLLILAATAAIVIVLVMAVLSQSLPTDRSDNAPLPTVTLSQRG